MRRWGVVSVALAVSLLSCSGSGLGITEAASSTTTFDPVHARQLALQACSTWSHRTPEWEAAEFPSFDAYVYEEQRLSGTGVVDASAEMIRKYIMPKMVAARDLAALAASLDERWQGLHESLVYFVRTGGVNVLSDKAARDEWVAMTNMNTEACVAAGL
jgi:hypothetical protein